MLELSKKTGGWLRARLIRQSDHDRRGTDLAWNSDLKWALLQSVVVVVVDAGRLIECSQPLECPVEKLFTFFLFLVEIKESAPLLVGRANPEYHSQTFS